MSKEIKMLKRIVNICEESKTDKSLIENLASIVNDMRALIVADICDREDDEHLKIWIKSQIDKLRTNKDEDVHLIFFDAGKIEAYKTMLDRLLEKEKETIHILECEEDK